MVMTLTDSVRRNAWVVVFLLVFCAVGCGGGGNSSAPAVTPPVVPDIPAAPDAPTVTSFKLNGVPGSIDQGTHTITVATQDWIEDIAKLKAEFVVTAGEVTVDGVAQESGVTENDFRREVAYIVAGEGDSKRTYTVRLASPQTTGLPVIKIDTKGNQAIVSKEDYVKTNIAVYDADNPEYEFAHTEYPDEVRGRGNSTWTFYDKKPYRIKFGKKTSLFGYEAAKSWVLLANYLDPTLMMNSVTFELGQRFGFPFANHFTHVEVFLNGKYNGSYVLTEQVQVGKGRVDIDEDSGFLVELDMTYDEEPRFTTDLYHLPVMIKSPEDLDDPAGYTFVSDAIKELESKMCVLSGGRCAPLDGAYRDLIDMDTFVDFLMINEIVENNEIRYPKSVYMYRDAGGKISMGPLWDFDWGFGYSGTGLDHRYFIGTNVDTALHPFLKRFFDDPVFTARYKARWAEMKGDVDGIPSFIDDLAAQLEKSQKENFQIWEDAGRSYDEEISAMKTWWHARIEYLDGKINRM